MDKAIEYYFTPSSPWTYLGHQRFVALAEKHGVRIDVKPVDLTNAVFPVSGGLPVSKRPKQRIAYRAVELKRWSAHLGIELNLVPRFFPVPADLAARAIIAADRDKGTAVALEFAGRVMATVWAEEGNIADRATLVKLAHDSGLDGERIVAQADSEDVKARYERYTQQAIERQVFGAPFYIYRDEPFWGQDRLEFLERALSE